MYTKEDLILKKDKLKTRASIVLLLLVGLVVSPFIYIAIGGIIGLAVASFIGFSLVQFSPWIALKISDIKYRLIDEENVSHIKKITEFAAENPIETLTCLLIEKNKAFEEFKINVQTSAAARDTFRDKVKKFAEKYPSRASEFESQYERMASLVDRKKLALTDAKRSLDDGASKLEEMKAYWEMSKDAIALNKAAGMDTGDAFERLKADTACDAVFESMNTAFAQLEVAAALDTHIVDQKTNVVQQLPDNNINQSLMQLKIIDNIGNKNEN